MVIAPSHYEMDVPIVEVLISISRTLIDQWTCHHQRREKMLVQEGGEVI